MWETWVQSLCQEDPLEKEMATHSSILAWKIPWTEEPGRLQFMGLQRVGHDWATLIVVMEKTLESLLHCKEISQSLMAVNPEYPLEELMLKLKLQHFGQPMWRSNSLEKILMLGKIERRRTRGWQRIRWLNGITDWMDMSLPRRQWRTVKPGMLQSIGSQSQTLLSNWTQQQQSHN